MTSPRGVLIFGANGSGKTTTGRELARILGFKHMDIEDYCFDESEIPYANPRPREVWLNMMLADIEKCRSFVITTCKGDLGDTIPQYYALAVHLSAAYDLRMERVWQRAYGQFGERILQGGDMYEREKAFFEFAANRPLSQIDQWAETLACPVMHMDGAEDWRVNAGRIAERFLSLAV